MILSQVESYRQLQQEYEQELERFTHDESAYREAAAVDAAAPDLRARYDQLATERQSLEAKLELLKQLRLTLAQRREEVAQDFAV
jgi:hypothetical protein